MKFNNKFEDIINIVNDKTIKDDVNLFYDKRNCYDLYFSLVDSGIEPAISIKNSKIEF